MSAMRTASTARTDLAVSGAQGHGDEEGLTVPRTVALFQPEGAALIDEYLVDMTRRARRSAAGYSPKTARSTGKQMLTKPRIKAAVAKALKAQQERTLITADKVLAGHPEHRQPGA